MRTTHTHAVVEDCRAAMLMTRKPSATHMNWTWVVLYILLYFILFSNFSFSSFITVCWFDDLWQSVKMSSWKSANSLCANVCVCVCMYINWTMLFACLLLPDVWAREQTEIFTFFVGVLFNLYLLLMLHPVVNPRRESVSGQGQSYAEHPSLIEIIRWWNWF